MNKQLKAWLLVPPVLLSRFITVINDKQDLISGFFPEFINLLSTRFKTIINGIKIQL